MACFGSDSSYLLEALLLSCTDSKKRKSGPQQSAERKRRKNSQGLAKWITSIPCVIMESSPEKSPSPACRAEFSQQISEFEPKKNPVGIQNSQKICFDIPFLEEATIELVLADLEKRKSSLEIRTCYSRLVTVNNRSGRHDTWTSKYMPTNSCALLGNNMALFKLKSWLYDWKLFIEKNDVDEISEKKNAKNSDQNAKKKEKISGRKSYLPDSDCEDLFEIPAPEEMPLTGFMVYGPPGVGKTAAMHALAEELGFTVLEINPASSKDAKQILLQSLEATQSHRVHTKSVAASQFISQTEKKADKRANTLILIDDADVLPEGEEFFITAVEGMLKKTKRPVIFTISGLSKVRLIQTESLEVGDLDFVRQPLVDIACYISLVALAECTVLPYDDAVSKVQSTNGDLRASLNLVQFWSSRNWLSVPKLVPLDDSVMILEDSLIENQPVAPPGCDLNEAVYQDLPNSQIQPVAPPADAQITPVAPPVNSQITLVASSADPQILPEIKEILENLLETVSSKLKNSRETASPEICDQSAEKRAFDEMQKLLKESQDAEMRSVLATVTSTRDGRFDLHSLSCNRPLAGVSEEFYEESATLECCFSVVERSAEICQEYEQILSSLTLPCLEISSKTPTDQTRTGRALYHRYGQYNPQIHARGYQFGLDHWSFIRKMAKSEFDRRQSEEQVKRRRLRFYNYLGPNTLHLPDELLNELPYSIGENLPQKNEILFNQ